MFLALTFVLIVAAADSVALVALVIVLRRKFARLAVHEKLSVATQSEVAQVLRDAQHTDDADIDMLAATLVLPVIDLTTGAGWVWKAGQCYTCTAPASIRAIDRDGRVFECCVLHFRFFDRQGAWITWQRMWR